MYLLLRGDATLGKVGSSYNGLVRLLHFVPTNFHILSNLQVLGTKIGISSHFLSPSSMALSFFLRTRLSLLRLKIASEKITMIIIAIMVQVKFLNPSGGSIFVSLVTYALHNDCIIYLGRLQYPWSQSSTHQEASCWCSLPGREN